MAAHSSNARIEIRDLPVGPVEHSNVFELRTVFRYSACGFLVPPYEMIEQWTGKTMPPLPRCIWCVNGWVVDTAPPGGAPPAGSGGAGPIVIRTRGKRAPTQHA